MLFLYRGFSAVRLQIRSAAILVQVFLLLRLPVSIDELDGSAQS